MDVHTFGGGKPRKKTETFDEIGRILVTGALNRTKQIRKAGGEISATKIGVENLDKNQTNPISPWSFS